MRERAPVALTSILRTAWVEPRLGGWRGRARLVAVNARYHVEHSRVGYGHLDALNVDSLGLTVQRRWRRLVVGIVKRCDCQPGRVFSKAREWLRRTILCQQTNEAGSRGLRNASSRQIQSARLRYHRCVRWSVGLSGPSLRWLFDGVSALMT